MLALTRSPETGNRQTAMLRTAFEGPVRDALDAPGLDGDRFLEPANDPGIGVARPETRGGIEGAIGQVSHAARTVAGRGAAGQWGGRPSGGIRG